MPGVEPPNRKRLEVHRMVLETAELQFGKRVAQALWQRRLFRRPRVRRKLIVDADVEMGPAIDQAWKRPRISADAGGDAFEIEDVALLEELARALRIDRKIEHQRATDTLLAVADHRRAHPAPGAIGTNQHRSLEGGALGPHSHRATGLLNLPHPASIDDLEARFLRRTREARVELIAPDHGAQRIAAEHFDLANLGARAAAHHLDGWNLELEAQLLEREHSLRNQTAGAGFWARMMRLLDRDHAPLELGMCAQQLQRGRQSSRTGAGDKYFAFDRR